MRLATLHRSVGLISLVVFLASGQYMRHLQPPLAELGPALHASFTSRHIYMLSAALVHLTLGAYVVWARGRRGQVLQGLGSTLLLVATLLLTMAFVVEPMAGRGRTAVSTFGLYALFAGSLTHFVAPSRRTQTIQRGDPRRGS